MKSIAPGFRFWYNGTVRKPGPLSICTKQENDMEHIGQKTKEMREKADLTQDRAEHEKVK